MKTIYAAGNLLVKEDSLPLRIMNRLADAFPGFEFVELEPTDDMPEERDIIIIDTVIGIDDVAVFTDIDAIATQKMFSLHDFDLGTTLKLLKKAGRLDGVKIIGVPAHLSEEKAVEQVTKILDGVS